MLKICLTQLLKYTLMLSVLFFIVSCKSSSENAYDKGYREGKSVGYSNGWDNGYSSGEETGYDNGLSEGRSVLLKGKMIPTAGGAILIAIFIAILFFLYKNYKNPIVRGINEITNKAELIRQKNILLRQLSEREKYNNRIAKIKAKEESLAFMEESKKILGELADDELLLKMQLKIDTMLYKSKLRNNEDITKEYKSIVDDLDEMKDLNSGEKINIISSLIQKIKQLVN